MENSKKTFVYAAKERRARTVRIVKINRVVALILVIAIALGGVVTFFAINANKKQKIDYKSFYFLQLGEYTSSGDALLKSLEIKNAGGSGYVINDGIFRVMATVFATKKEAQSVQNRLEEGGSPCKIYEVKTKKVTLSKYDSDAQVKQIKELLSYPLHRLFSELQHQDITLDSGETTDSAALLAVSNLLAETTKKHEEIIKLLSSHPADKLLNSLQKTYKEIIASFNNYLPKSELTIGTGIKSVLCSIVEAYITNL